MSTTLTDIAELGLQPLASRAPQLLTGKIRIGVDLISVFTDNDNDKRRFRVVWDAAVTMQMSPQEMESNIQGAIAMASSLDASAGWIAPEGATGQDKYGPKRTAMNARASEIRQLFGALKFAKHSITQDSGFTASVKRARSALKDAAITWEGVPAKEKQDTTLKALSDVRMQWIKDFPQLSGESLQEYNERMSPAVEILALEAVTAREEKAIVGAANKLMEKYGMDMAATIAEKVIEMFNRAVENAEQGEM